MKLTYFSFQLVSKRGLSKTGFWTIVIIYFVMRFVIHQLSIVIILKEELQKTYKNHNSPKKKGMFYGLCCILNQFTVVFGL